MVILLPAFEDIAGKPICAQLESNDMISSGMSWYRSCWQDFQLLRTHSQR